MPGTSHCGAYGFRLVLADPGVRLDGLVPLPPETDEVRLAWRAAPTPHDAFEAGEDRVLVAVKGQVTLEVLRRPRSVSLALPTMPTADAIVHPVATTPLAILSRWRGDVALHAGAVVHDGGAYALCGAQGAGKSTMLALLAERGLPVAADDLLVVDDGDVLVGPRCVDLRPDVASRFPEARFLGVVGARERYRLSTAAAPPRVPLRGLFLLEWTDAPTTSVSPLSLEERVGLVHEFDYAALVGLPHPEALLDLLALPMWRFARPRDWGASDDALDRFLETAGGH